MRCYVCDDEDATVVDPRTGDILCNECADVIQEDIGHDLLEDILDEVFGHVDDT